MTRVSPPELARACPGPHASTRVTRAPFRSSDSAVYPPKTPAPTTTICCACAARTRTLPAATSAPLDFKKLLLVIMSSSGSNLSYYESFAKRPGGK